MTKDWQRPDLGSGFLFKSKSLPATSGCRGHSLKAPWRERSHVQYLEVCDKYYVALAGGPWALRSKQ